MLQSIQACITPVLSGENCMSPGGILFLIPSPKERRAVLQRHCPGPGVTALDSHKEEMRVLGDDSGESTMLVIQARGPTLRALASTEKPNLLGHLCSPSTGVGGRVQPNWWGEGPVRESISNLSEGGGEKHLMSTLGLQTHSHVSKNECGHTHTPHTKC